MGTVKDTSPYNQVTPLLDKNSRNALIITLFYSFERRSEKSQERQAKEQTKGPMVILECAVYGCV